MPVWQVKKLRPREQSGLSRLRTQPSEAPGGVQRPESQHQTPRQASRQLTAGRGPPQAVNGKMGRTVPLPGPALHHLTPKGTNP